MTLLGAAGLAEIDPLDAWLLLAVLGGTLSGVTVGGFLLARLLFMVVAKTIPHQTSQCVSVSPLERRTKFQVSTATLLTVTALAAVSLGLIVSGIQTLLIGATMLTLIGCAAFGLWVVACEIKRGWQRRDE